MRRAAGLPGDQQLVRAGLVVQGPDGRAQPADPAGCPSTSRTAASASGWPTPATGASAATASGAHRSRCGGATIPNYPRIDVYGSIADLERDFGVEIDDLHRPFVDNLVRPESRRPDGQVDDAPGHRGARLLVRVRVDAVRPGALPVRERRLVREPLPGRLHRRVHGPDARLVLHAARAGDGAVRSAGVPQLRQPRHRARRRRPEDVEEPQQLPGPDDGLRHVRRRRDALVPAVVDDPARRRPRRSPRTASARACATSCCRSGTRTRSSRCTRMPPATPRNDAPTSTDPLDQYILGKLHALVADVTDGDGRLRPVRSVWHRSARSSTR